jgi:hypothetical protein
MTANLNLDALTLHSGSHPTRQQGVCLMEAAARDAAWVAAGAAARDAAWVAAGAAARDALRPTVEQLQNSAIALYGDLITAGVTA